MPDPNDPGMGYAYVVMTLVFIAASFTVFRMKKHLQKKESKKNEPEAFEMYDPKKDRTDHRP